MTAQITDRVVYLDESYELIWDGCLVPYIRERYQLNQLIGGETSICYRGYCAEYEIHTAHLYLCFLRLFAMIHPYPKIAGIVGEESYYWVSRKVRKHDPKKERYGTTGWVEFSPLQERIDVSGYILLGQGMNGYEDYMQSAAYYPYACKKLLGITLVNGQPKKIEDFSQEAEAVRIKFKTEQLTQEEIKAIAEEFRKKVFKRS